jgi:L-cysteine desulfidase
MKIKSKGKIYEYEKTLVVFNKTTHQRLKEITKKKKMSFDTFVNILLDNYHE